MTTRNVLIITGILVAVGLLVWVLSLAAPGPDPGAYTVAYLKSLGIVAYNGQWQYTTPTGGSVSGADPAPLVAEALADGKGQ